MNVKLNLMFFTLLFLFVSFNDKDITLYKTNKVEISSINKGIRVKYNFKNFDNNESIKVQYFLFSKEKKIIGSESFTNNKMLIQNYISKYKKKAVILHKEKNDIQLNEERFKIVYEIKNKKLFFYYYRSDITSSLSASKRGGESTTWTYHGESKFLFDIYINNILVLSKHFDLNNQNMKI